MSKSFALTFAALACAISLYTLAKAQEPDPHQDAAALSLSNAKQLSTAMLMYAMDYDEMFPYGKTMAEIKPKVEIYSKDRNIFVDPTSGKDFLYNSVMSAMPQKRIKDAAKSVLFYSPSAHTDGLFTVAYADGHAKREMSVPKLTVEKKPQPVKKALVKPTKTKSSKKKR